MKIVAIIIGILLLAWIAWSYYGVRNVEKPNIISSMPLSGGVVLIQVAPMIQATVTVSWKQSDAIKKWFRQLAEYIFGGNEVKKPIAMTAPVGLAKSNTSIAMTVPVSAQQRGNMYDVSFMMPSTYTLATLPAPINNNIQFKEIPAKEYYVRKFNGYANQARARKQLAHFKAILSEQKISPVGQPILNQYNDPWTMPLMRKNERRIEKE